jgi:hypothetical protein
LTPLGFGNETTSPSAVYIYKKIFTRRKVMKMRQMFKLLAGFLAVLMIISVLPVSAFAVINYD